ncbi:hypothetical protein BDW74DRAFT_157369 [Aspergillus multicolor]|uniref:uncharacterized protein n=1 Tax=Aspergillus multicolor TaxID=41759 RepID=UPI003CCCFA74
MKFFTTAAVLALLSLATAAPVDVDLSERQSNTRTVALTNEFTGGSQSSAIPTNGVNQAMPPRYPDRYNPTFRVDSVMITSGVVAGAKCTISGNRVDNGAFVELVTVDAQKNYARFPQGVAKPETLVIKCV